jgi:hypothetical protein
MRVTSCRANLDATMVELASGVDSLYLSGRAALPEEFLRKLEEARQEAEATNEPVLIAFGNTPFALAPFGLRNYRYRLVHPHALLAVTTGTSFPAFRIQPSAELLHAIGPEETVRWITGCIEAEIEEVFLTVSRVDIHADFQGWRLSGDERYRFVGKSRTLTTYEDGEDFTGFSFGTHASAISCRIYDKTIEIKKSGADYCYDLWGAAFESDKPVLRVEFEISREGLRQFRLGPPSEVLAAVPRMWAHATSEFLRYCVPTNDETKSRWPVASEWQAVQQASVRGDALGLERITAGRRQGDLRLLMPRLMGDLSAYAAMRDTDDLGEVMRKLEADVDYYSAKTGVSFSDRVIKKVLQREWS